MIEIPKEGNVVLKFGTEWCPPCKQLKPILEEVRKDNKDVEFIEIDADKNRELNLIYDVKGIPKLVFIRDGEVKSETVGLKTKTEIQENINLLGE